MAKSNLENLDDLRRRLFGQLRHEFSAYRGILKFPNGSKIIAGHYQSPSDLDAYLGLEYDVIAIEEATTLTSRKHQDIGTCCRTSKPNWRPRIYSTTNPGGIGHAWYRQKFIVPYLKGEERETRFVPAKVGDNQFNNPEYARVLQNLTGWQRRAWLDGDWDIAAGQFFTTFRRDAHVIEDFDDTRAREWFCALDYGFTHYTVVLLGCTDSDGNVFIVDEHAERLWLPQRHAAAVKSMLARHTVGAGTNKRPLALTDLKRFVAGADVFSRQSDGSTVAAQYAKLGITLRMANSDRINGWAEILQRLGDPDAGLRADDVHSPAMRAVAGMPADTPTRSASARRCVEGGRRRGRDWRRRRGGLPAVFDCDEGARVGVKEVDGGVTEAALDRGRLLLQRTSIRTRAIEADRVIEPFWVDKIGKGAGRGVGPDGLPGQEVGAGLDHNGLIGEGGEGEAEAARFQARATRGHSRRAQHHGGQAAVACSPAGGAAVIINLRACANGVELGISSIHVKIRVGGLPRKVKFVSLEEP